VLYGQQITVLDSLNRDRPEVLRRTLEHVQALYAKFGMVFEGNAWTRLRIQASQQLNGNDGGPCGMHWCHSTLAGAPLTGLPRDFRYKVLMSLLCGELGSGL
jgi:hypothetical protein